MQPILNNLVHQCSLYNHMLIETNNQFSVIKQIFVNILPPPLHISYHDAKL